MPALCPNCQTPADQDFGMVTCASCAQVFMVNFDGEVSVGGGPATSEEAPSDQEPSVEIPEHHLEETSEFLEESVEEPLAQADEELVSNFGAPGDDLASTEAEDFMAPEEEQAPQSDFMELPQEEEMVVASSSSEEPVMDLTGQSADFEQPVSGGAEELTKTPPPVSKKDPLAIEEFDGSSESQLLDGPYYYQLKVTGLDTMDLKEQVIEALLDPRLSWNQSELVALIQKGEMVFGQLNPVVASIVVTSLSNIDVDISWTQTLYTAEKTSENEEE